MQTFVAGDFYTRTARPSRAIASGHSGFVREYDIFTDDELASDPIYRDLLWPAGLGWAAAMAIRLPTGDELFLSVDAVKGHLRALFEKLEVENLPHNQKRVRLVERALESGVLGIRELQ